MEDKTKVRKLRKLLQEVQTKHLHEPDPDGYEYCPGCGLSPHWDPPHRPGCLVPEIERVLRETK